MHRAVLALVLFASLFTIVALGTRMPDVVASHFNAAGIADGFLPRAKFLANMGALAVGLPLLVWALVTFVSARAPLNVPNAEFWNDPALRPAVVAYMSRWASGLAIAICVFLTALFVLIHQAQSAPGGILALPHWALVAEIAGLLLYVAGAVVHLVRHFSRVPGGY